MQFVYISFVLLFFYTKTYGDDLYTSWAGNTLHCRNNDFKPVKWWYIYKPPSGINYSIDDGRNFSYITSEETGKFVSPHISIKSNSMLQNTLSPLYKRTYDMHMGGLMYSNSNDSIANGLLVTDIVGGFWLTHTIPDFPDLSQDLAMIPEHELNNGHLIMCISLEFKHQKKIYETIMHAKPKFKHLFLSNVYYRDILPTLSSQNPSKEIKTLTLPIINNGKAVIMVRPPGNHDCLYKKFAKDHSIILDVYGRNSDNKYLTTVCSQKYGLRNIESISFKHLYQEVHYLHDKLDHSKWAVSTAAHWQRRGGAGAVYWTCTNTVNKEEDKGKGAILICVHDYGIWLSFDKLKVAEPVCYS